jgi:hypothetical protein
MSNTELLQVITDEQRVTRAIVRKLEEAEEKISNMENTLREWQIYSEALESMFLHGMH